MAAVTVVPQPEVVLARLEQIIPLLYHAIESGVSKALAYQYDGARDPWLASHLVRHHAKTVLKALGHDVDEMFDLNEKSPLSGLSFSYRSQYGFKVLKADRLGGLPSAGNSDRRKEFYCQESLAPELLGIARESLPELPLNLVVLWEVDAAFNLLGLTLVCPKSDSPLFGDDGQVLRSAELHWSIPIPHPAASAPPVMVPAAPTDLPITPKRPAAAVAESGNE